jgi:hypothetical protein
MANTIQIAADTSQFVSGVNRAQTAMRGLGSTIQSATAPTMFGGLAGGFGKLLGGVSIMATLAAATRSFYAAMEAGGSLVDLSGQTGVAIDKLMVLQSAFEQAGMSAGDVQPTIAKLQKSIAEAATGNDQAIAKFKAMGIAIGDIQGLSADQQLAAVGEAIGKIENPAQRSAMAMEIFGKSGAKLLSVFSAGGLEDVQSSIGNQAQLMVENAGIFDRATDVLGMAGTKMQGFFVGMASQILPPLMGVVDTLNGLDLSGIGQDLGDAIATWIVYFQNFDTVGSIVGNTLQLAFLNAINVLDNAIAPLGDQMDAAMELAFADAVNYFGEIFTNTIPEIYASMKLAFANSINFLATELSAIFASGAAKTKALFKGQNPEDAGKKAEAEVRARPPLIDTAKLTADLKSAQEKPIEPLIDTTPLIANLEALKNQPVELLFDTSDLEDKIQAQKDILDKAKTEAGTSALKNYATPAPAATGGGFIPKMDEKPLGSIVSSMAKIGGDVGGPQTGALDVARQQLTQQQRTADNTAKMVEKLNKLTPAQSTQSVAIYS